MYIMAMICVGFKARQCSWLVHWEENEFEKSIGPALNGKVIACIIEKLVDRINK